MTKKLALILINEVGEELTAEVYDLHLDLDTDELDIWQERKVRQLLEEYSEARGAYWEDRTNWTHQFNLDHMMGLI